MHAGLTSSCFSNFYYALLLLLQLQQHLLLTL